MCERLQLSRIVNNYERIIKVTVMELYPQKSTFYIDTHAGQRGVRRGFWFCLCFLLFPPLQDILKDSRLILQVKKNVHAMSNLFYQRVSFFVSHKILVNQELQHPWCILKEKRNNEEN